MVRLKKYHSFGSLEFDLIICAVMKKDRTFSPQERIFGKKANFRVKNVLLSCPTIRQSIVMISDKRSIYA
jgi:hypothetical protein